jgi:5-formyltetrahydrofolate cyclo-ligase
MNKIELRVHMKKQRDKIKTEFINEASATIANKFMTEFGHLDSFVIYYEIDNEVKTSELINTLILNKKSVYLPIYKKDFEGFGLCDNLNKMIAKKNGLREPI